MPIKKRAHVVDVDMGYGHARAAHALKDLSGGEIISANNYPGMPAQDAKLWKESRTLYEAVSRLKPIPVIGDLAFGIMDEFQQVPPFYPRRDLSKPSFPVKQSYRIIKKTGMGRHLINQLAKNPLPLVTTFFTVAFMAELFDYPGAIYVVTTDADIARHWVPLDPKSSRIIYIAANGRCQERLKLYGVPETQIHLTGFPLPKDLIGGYPETLLQKELMARVCNLDPDGIFCAHHKQVLEGELGPGVCKMKKTHPLTLAFSVGGAGAQKKLGVQIMQSLKAQLIKKEIRLALFAGVRQDIADYFLQEAKASGLQRLVGDGLLIPIFKTRSEYFQGFNDFLHETDMLMTKPSELSFYTGLGLPIVMAPPIGSQEIFNSLWLQYVGGGVAMSDPRYINEWLFDWIHSGGLARMAWNGYMEAPTHGTYRIEALVTGQKSEIHPLPLIV